MILIGEGVMPVPGVELKPEDPGTMAMTPVSRRRVSAAGRWYQDHASTFAAQGAQIVVGGGTHEVFDWPGEDDETSSATLAHYLNIQYIGQKRPPIVEVQTGHTPFAVFKDMVDQGLFADVEFTPDNPLILSAGRLYGNSVLAPIARAVFDIKKRDAIRVLSGEASTLHRRRQSRDAALLTHAVLVTKKVKPHDPSSLAGADQLYEDIKLSRIAAAAR
jgi:hypothetical protein